MNFSRPVAVVVTPATDQAAIGNSPSASDGGGDFLELKKFHESSLRLLHSFARCNFEHVQKHSEVTHR